MDAEDVWTDDTLESGSEREGGGLLSDEDGAESSEPEAAAVTVKKRNERKKSSLFAWFPTPKAEESTTDEYGRQNYKVYRWRWFMLITMFLLNVSNGTVSGKTVKVYIYLDQISLTLLFNIKVQITEHNILPKWIVSAIC